MDQYTDDAGLNDELKTCKKYIDHALEQRGWLRKYVKEQVNHVKSDFKRKKYTYNNGKTEDIDEFIDYILLDEDYTVLAIIEAKKFSVNENEWQIQAKTYIKNIEEQFIDILVEDDLEQVSEFHWAILDTAGCSTCGARICAGA